MRCTVEGLTTTYLAAGVLENARLIGTPETDGTVNYAATGALSILGVTKEVNMYGLPCAAGDEVSVILDGIVHVMAGAAIANKAQITVGTSGKAITKGTTDVAYGTAMEAATGDGDIILVKLALN